MFNTLVEKLETNAVVTLHISRTAENKLRITMLQGEAPAVQAVASVEEWQSDFADLFSAQNDAASSIAAATAQLAEDTKAKTDAIKKPDKNKGKTAVLQSEMPSVKENFKPGVAKNAEPVPADSKALFSAKAITTVEQDDEEEVEIPSSKALAAQGMQATLVRLTENLLTAKTRLERLAEESDSGAEAFDEDGLLSETYKSTAAGGNYLTAIKALREQKKLMEAA